jgi:hypothetical protein
MIHIHQMIGFIQDPLDRDNYKTLQQFNQLPSGYEIRIDHHHQFYILTQPTEGILKVIYAVINFFIKLIREGIESDDSIDMQLEQFGKKAVLKGHLQAEMGEIARELFHCGDLPKQSLLVKSIQQQGKNLRELIAKVNELMGEVWFLKSIHQDFDFSEIELGLRKLISVAEHIPILKDYPYPLPVSISRLIDYLFSEEQAIHSPFAMPGSDFVPCLF